MDRSQSQEPQSATVQTDLGRMVYNVARVRLTLLIIVAGLVLALCAYATVVFIVLGFWNAAHGR